MGSRFGYLFAVVDACDRGIPGSAFGDRCRAIEAVQALGVTLEYAGIQCPEDKPYIESFGASGLEAVPGLGRGRADPSVPRLPDPSSG